MATGLAAKRALVLAPHPDDGELGCGGTICRLLEEGVDVHTVVFSRCEASLPDDAPRDLREQEAREAILSLGMAAERLTVWPYPVRRFDQHRQEMLDRLIALRDALDPDLVFLPCPQDVHQDHVVVATEGIRAFKRHTVLAYELPWNNLTFSTSCFIALEERHVARKIEAMNCYLSQQHRPYADPTFISGLARTRGVESGYTFAEAFQTIRLTIAHVGQPLLEQENASAATLRRKPPVRHRIPPAFAGLSTLGAVTES